MLGVLQAFELEVAHDLALFGLLLGFHGQLEKWANFGVDRGRGGIRGMTRLLKNGWILGLTVEGDGIRGLILLCSIAALLLRFADVALEAVGAAA